MTKMREKKLRYRILESTTAKDLSDQVSAVLSDGASLYGSPTATTTGAYYRIFQAVVYEEDDDQ